MNWLRRLLCRHTTVRVVRYHAHAAPIEWKPRLLYVDRLKVHNYVQCAKCGQVLRTDQRERLYEQEKYE